MKKHTINSIIFFLLMVFGITYVSSRDGQTNYDSKPEYIPAKIALASNEVVIPMEIINRHLVVEVKINGKGPYKFVLDTAAGTTIINQDLANELNLSTKGTRKMGDPSNPTSITANLNSVEKLEIGGATFSDFVVASWGQIIQHPGQNSGAPRGILGKPLFTNLLLTIDYPQNKIVIKEGALPKENNQDIIEYKSTESGLLGVPLSIAGTNMIATLDTGSPTGVSFPSSYMDKLSLESKPTEIARARTISGEAIIYGAKLNGNIKLGNYQFENPNVQFFGRLTHLNIGYEFLRQFAVTIDQKNRRMKFERTTVAEVKNAHSTPVKDNKFIEYTGLYDERRFMVENGNLYLQRISGPHGEGPKIRLTQINKDEFAFENTNVVRIKFVRNQKQEITEVQVLAHNDQWESSKKSKQ